MWHSNTRRVCIATYHQVVFTDEYATPLIMKAVSYQLHDKVTFGEVRASNLALSSRFGISKYPSLLAICDEKGLAVATYDGEFKIEPIISFLNGLKSGEVCKAARSESKERVDNVKKNLSTGNMNFTKVSSIYYS